MTINDIELSLFANAALVEETFREVVDKAAHSSNGSTSPVERVEISEHVWTALQVEQHGEDFRKFRRRIRDWSHTYLIYR